MYMQFPESLFNQLFVLLFVFLTASYMVSIGIVDKVSLCISGFHGTALDEKRPEPVNFLMDGLSLLTCVTALLVSLRYESKKYYVLIIRSLICIVVLTEVRKEVIMCLSWRRIRLLGEYQLALVHIREMEQPVC